MLRVAAAIKSRPASSSAVVASFSESLARTATRRHGVRALSVLTSSSSYFGGGNSGGADPCVQWNTTNSRGGSAPVGNSRPNIRAYGCGIDPTSIITHIPQSRTPTTNATINYRSFSTAVDATHESLSPTADKPNPIAPHTPSSTNTDPPFSKILIANRGEIALRIIRTCRSLGIRTVAVHSTIDVRSPHVLAADEAICLGPAPTSESYLNVDAVCDAITTTGAQAVHPGYGFLSENAEFARRVTELGAKFVGPSNAAITAMGDKITSKKIAREADVSVIPGYDGFVSSPEHAVEIAEEVGYPVMIKATSGGGGKGMRICTNPEEVREGYQLSTAEAKSFFGDERLFIERYVEDPHHIEFQVLAGRKKKKGSGKGKSHPAMNPFPILEGKEEYGELDILVFPERECSIQRRNQKVIEESPSVLLTPETRAEMAKQVRSLVRNVDYESAGTVEFLVDEQQNFFFLEMNTRLQVEHPITEMVSGDVDLVRGMFDVAAGRGVPEEYLALMDGDDDGAIVRHSGHAIEARIYAEDPLRGFLPSTGPLLQYIEPTQGPAHEEEDMVDSGIGSGSVIRVDSGVVCGTPITPYYDPMISKLVAYSPEGRAEAIDALSDALDRYVIHGVGHNCPFVADVLRHAAFREGRTPTNFIPTHYPEGFAGVELTDEEREELAALSAAVGGWRMALLDQPPLPCTAAADDVEADMVVCLGGMFGEAYIVAASDPESSKLTVRPWTAKDDEKVEAREMEIQIGGYEYTSPVVEVCVDGVEKAIQVQPEDNTGMFAVKMHGADVNILLMSRTEYELSRHMKEPPIRDTSGLVLSPMPGTLMSYSVEEGDHVEAGQEICIVEAMKMQNVIRAERHGIVAKIYPAVGASLRADEVIVEFQKEE
mmetsp:Transcript_13081/g.27663  ORF Transcript_13081/g.27663 Transcript_13081/m.27663 type:complete len:885 (-) Transcript_13081:129-2783(-)